MAWDIDAIDSALGIRSDEDARRLLSTLALRPRYYAGGELSGGKPRPSWDERTGAATVDQALGPGRRALGGRVAAPPAAAGYAAAPLVPLRGLGKSEGVPALGAGRGFRAGGALRSTTASPLSGKTADGPGLGMRRAPESGGKTAEMTAQVQQNRPGPSAKNGGAKQPAPSKAGKETYPASAGGLSRWLDLFKPAPPPPSPRPPAAPIVGSLHAERVAGIVYNETKSLRSSGKEKTPIADARNRVAHAILNAEEKFGARGHQKHASTASSAVSRAEADSPEFQSVRASVLRAFNEHQRGADPTHGALFFNMRRTDVTDPFQLRKLSTQSGPYKDASRRPGRGRRRTVFVNTY